MSESEAKPGAATRRTRLRRLLGRAFRSACYRVPVLGMVQKTRGTAAPVTFRGLFLQKVLGFNRNAYWPMHHSSLVTHPRKVAIGIGTAPGLSGGCYIQGNNGIVVGDYTLVAPNVGLISASHSPYDHREHEHADPIRIGDYCWIGMNAVVLPGVVLGNHTVVAAGSVVTGSFPEGYCVLGGVPARVLKTLDPEGVTQYSNEFEFLGFHELRGRSKEELLHHLGVEVH